ncbi:MAG: hypothetical protein P8I55_14040 [Crocinitomix sp.]|nr:hypothetical protein [Crocinitomix sp.]
METYLGTIYMLQATGTEPSYTHEVLEVIAELLRVFDTFSK